MDEVQLSQEYGNTIRRRLLFTNESPIVLDTYFINQGRMIEPLSDFQPGIPGLGSEHLNTRSLLQNQVQKF